MNAQTSTMSTTDYNDISQRVDNIEGLVNKIERGQKEGFRKLFLEIESLKKDNTMTIDGDSRHNVRAVRDIAEEAITRSREAHRRLDHILWLVAGISVGTGISASAIVKLVFGI